MNGIERITTKITQDMQAEIDAVTSEATAKAAEIDSAYAARVKHLEEDMTARATANANERRERLVSAAHLEAKKLFLGVRQEVIGKAFQKAQDDLAALPKKDYEKLLTDLAVKASVSGAEELIFSAEDRKSVGKGVVAAANEALTKAGKNGALTLSERTAAITGGVILSDGKVETNCSFETLLRLGRTEIASSVSAALFE